MYKVYISNPSRTSSLLLPVTPSEIEIDQGTDVIKYTTVNGENKSQAGKKTLCKVSFSSVFPSGEREYQTCRIDAMYCIQYIQNCMLTDCVLTIAGMNFDRPMIIDSFNYIGRRGLDIKYTISFTEKR